jgi:hypothetical protein
MATTPISGKRMFSLAFMGSRAYVAAPIPRLICLEVVEALCSTFRQRSGVTVMRIIPVVNMSVKVPMAVKPRACSNKYPAGKPIGPVVAVRSAVIGGIVEISIRTYGSRSSDLYANGDLSWRHRGRTQKASYENRESKRTDFEHDFSSLRSEF